METYKIKLIISIALVVFTIQCSGYRILLLDPVASKSIHIAFSSLGRELATRGHDVTMITPFPDIVKHPKLLNLQLSRETETLSDLSPFELASLLETFDAAHELANETAEIMWSDPRILEIWKHRNEFDAIVIHYFMNEIAFPFLLNYTGSFVLFCTYGVEHLSMSLLGNWLSPAVVSSYIQPFDDKMTFKERVINTATVLFEAAVNEYYYFPKLQKTVDRYFPDNGDIISLYWTNSLTLIGGHFALDAPAPLLPNQVEIGTIHIKPSKPLPKDIAEFAEGSGDAGVIYFSLGTILTGKMVPQKIKDAFVEAFSRLPQRIIWKYDNNDLKLPPNVLARKWLPQQDILGHPKTRVFISHAGLLSTHEAMYHGVPVVAFPIFFDQPRNARRLSKKGYGVVLKWNEVTAEKIVDAVNTVLKIPAYKERLQNISRVLKDQKETAGERAVWWIEYTIRHKGSQHLQYAGTRLHFLQYILVDVMLFFAAVIIVLTISISKLLKLVFKGREKKKKD